jgi:hypothetical protein
MRNSTVTSGAIVTSNAIRGSAKGAAAKLLVRRTCASVASLEHA